jgi:hypothetical protein
LQQSRDSAPAQTQMSTPIPAQTKMKALVVSRLLMGEISSWAAFEHERKTADQITNRRIARSVSSQIGRRYRELSKEVRNFINENFTGCDYADLARLCDDMRLGAGMSVRLDEFEKQYFPLSESVRSRFPCYAHVHISTYGLNFEFPEHHFLRDIETSLPELLETMAQLAEFRREDSDAKLERTLVASLVAKENFLNRSIISATFSLAEAFISGLFFTAIHSGVIGGLGCNDDFLKFARAKESGPLRDRIDRVVRFASKGDENGADEPFSTFIEVGKRYRDAIHHTTPFGRKDVEPGGRLTALYEINRHTTLRCVVLACKTILRISHWIDQIETDVAIRSSGLLRTVDAVGNEEFPRVIPQTSSHCAAGPKLVEGSLSRLPHPFFK